MNGWIGARTHVLSWIDRSRTAKHRTAAALAALARRRGADEGVLDAAVAGTHDRSAEATLQMIRWAQALAGTAATPRYFRPAAYLDAATIDRLRHDSTQRDRSDPHLVRQLWSLAPKENMDALRREVADRLPGMVNELIPSHATTNTSASQLAAIDAVTRALEVHDHRPAVLSGTLLGVIRDGRPMAHDYDVDMGLLPGHEDPSTIASWLRSIDGDVEVRPGRIVLTTAAGVKVDLFFHIERDGLLWHHTDIHEWWNTAFSLTEHEVDGVRMWRPDDAERYLFENYGPGWTRRSVFYDMSFDTPNRRYSETPEAISYLTFRLLLALENRDRWVYERCANALDEHFDIAVEPSSTPTTAAAR